MPACRYSTHSSLIPCRRVVIFRNVCAGHSTFWAETRRPADPYGARTRWAEPGMSVVIPGTTLGRGGTKGLAKKYGVEPLPLTGAPSHVDDGDRGRGGGDGGEEPAALWSGEWWRGGGDVRRVCSSGRRAVPEGAAAASVDAIGPGPRHRRARSLCRGPTPRPTAVVVVVTQSSSRKARAETCSLQRDDRQSCGVRAVHIVYRPITA